MTLNKIKKCVSLGHSLRDKLMLGYFAIVAHKREPKRKRLWRILSLALPRVWLRPGDLNGNELLIDPSDWSQTCIFEEVFFESGYDLTKVKFNPEVIIDCGAHIGIFSLLAKSRFPLSRLLAFEPNPNNIWFVQQQIKKNNLGIELVTAAVSTEAKKLYFSASNSHNGKLLTNGESRNAFEVQTINFSDVLKKIKPQSLLLKMDVEGEERTILPAIMPLLPKQTVLFFETHAGEADWHEIEALLVSNGFHVEQINARGKFFDGFAVRDSTKF